MDNNQMRIEEISKRIQEIEWDRKHNRVFAKQHMYKGLMEELEALKAE